MADLSLRSESLIGSLCREVERLRQRSSQLQISMRACHDGLLRARLSEELNHLEWRRRTVRDTAKSLRRMADDDGLTLEFLIEVASRPGIA